jgi:hypothetical protein
MKEQDTTTDTRRRDPIVEEVREIRQEHARKFNYDPEAIVEDLRRHQAEGKFKVVSFPAQRLDDKRKAQHSR